jgi:hypothetical protein
MSHTDPTDFIGAQERAQAEALAADLKRQQEIADFKWLVGQKQGRRVLWRWLKQSGVNKSSMTGNSYTFYNEGLRAFGIQVMDELREHSIDAYVLMVKENAK